MKFFSQTSSWMINIYILVAFVCILALLRTLYRMIIKKEFSKLTFVYLGLLVLTGLMAYSHYGIYYDCHLNDITVFLSGEHEYMQSHTLTEEEKDLLKEQLASAKYRFRYSKEGLANWSELNMSIHRRDRSETYRFYFNDDYEIEAVTIDGTFVDFHSDDFSEIIRDIFDKRSLKEDQVQARNTMIRRIFDTRMKDMSYDEWKAALKLETDMLDDTLMTYYDLLNGRDLTVQIKKYESHMYNERVGDKFIANVRVNLRLGDFDLAKTFEPWVRCVVEYKYQEEWVIDYIYLDLTEIKNIYQ